MANLHQKVLEVKAHHGHGYEEIRAFVNLEIKRLQELYKKESDIKSISDKYRSTSYKTFMVSGADKKASYFSELLKKCLLEESNISNFIKSGSEFIQHSSKDFFAIYCGYEGYNDFIDKNKVPRVEGKINNNLIIKGNEIGNLPKKLNNVPDLEIENYVSRISIVEEISNLFEQKNKKINITGISGIGKTFLAKHFVQHYLEKFSHIVWLNCSNGILKAFTHSRGIVLLDTMGLASEYKSYAEGNINAEEIMSMVLGRLQHLKNNCILVLDNVDEEIYNYELYLPSNWKILTTSQKKIEGFYNFRSPYFEEKATTLFYKYYTFEKDDDSLIRLLSAIEYHTLTVELLAKTAEQRQITIIDLVKRFIESGVNVVEKARITSEHSNERRQTIENIESYLNIIFDTSDLSTEEFKIILNLALMQNEAISTELFVDVYLFGAKDKRKVDILYGDIDILSKKGWIGKTNNEILLHNLIKQILLKKNVNDQSSYISSVNYLISCLGLNDFTDAIRYFSLLENISKNSQSDALIKFMAEPMSAFYNQLGLHHKSLELYSAYFPLDIKSLDFENLNNYAYRFKCLENYYDALECYYEIYNHFASQDPSMDYMFAYFESFCYEERKSNTAENEKALLNIMSNLLLGLILFVENIYHIGEVYFNDKTLKKRKKAILFLKDALNHENTLIKGIEFYLNKVGEIEAFSQKNLKRCKNIYSSINTCLGALYLSLKDYEKAFSFFEESIKIIEQLYGQHSHHLLQNYRKLFDFFLAKEDTNNATAYLDKHIFICERFPENHPEKVYQRKMQAKLYMLNNSLSKKKAQKLMKSVEEIVISEIKHRLKKAIEVPDYVKEKGDGLVEIYKISWINYSLSVDSYAKEIALIPLLGFHENRETALELLIRYLGIISITYAEYKNYDKAIRYLTLSIEYKKKHFPEDLMSSSISNVALAQLYLSDGKFELAKQSNKSGIEGLVDILANNSTHLDEQMIKKSLKIAYENQDEIEKELKKYLKN